MTSTNLHVWRDVYQSYEYVGTIELIHGEMRFRYDKGYGGPAISVRLPVQDAPFSEQDTRHFFSALALEGPIHDSFRRMLRTEPNEYLPFLESLNDESIGALVFSSQAIEPGAQAEYVPIGPEYFSTFSQFPHQTAVDTLASTRLSLTGAVAKIGLYRDEDATWYFPKGSAPSTHIVKAGSETFPHEVLNEAICLEAARLCGFDTPATHVIATPKNEPLLAVERFDRPIPDEPKTLQGHAVPLRLHQEDFCQIIGLPASLKYEPTDGNYLSLLTGRASRCCANGFGESLVALSYVFFDYLIGNCDNHLKNFSLLYDRTGENRQVAPLYDIVNTTLYRNLYTEMGVSFGGSRSIFGLKRTNIEQAVRAARLPTRLAFAELDELSEKLPAAIESACQMYSNKGHEHIDELAELMLDGVEKRRSFNYDANNAKTF